MLVVLEKVDRLVCWPRPKLLVEVPVVIAVEMLVVPDRVVGTILEVVVGPTIEVVVVGRILEVVVDRLICGTEVETDVEVVSEVEVVPPNTVADVTVVLPE